MGMVSWDVYAPWQLCEFSITCTDHAVMERWNQHLAFVGRYFWDLFWNWMIRSSIPPDVRYQISSVGRALQLRFKAIKPTLKFRFSLDVCNTFFITATFLFLLFHKFYKLGLLYKFHDLYWLFNYCFPLARKLIYLATHDFQSCSIVSKLLQGLVWRRIVQWLADGHLLPLDFRSKRLLHFVVSTCYI